MNYVWVKWLKICYIKVKIYVNECKVKVRGNSIKTVIIEDEKKKYLRTKGSTRLVDKENNIVFQWLLLNYLIPKYYGSSYKSIKIK